jgi:heme oxygenase (mycobilin-producing)
MSGPVTLINVFEIDQDKIDPFVDEWRARAEFMSKQPGFRSSRLHRALMPESRFQLINVAEWETEEALRAATSQEYFQKSARRSVQDFAATAHPAIYRVAIEL